MKSCRFLLLLAAVFAIAQFESHAANQQNELDSLQALLELATDSHRVDVLLALSDEYYNLAGGMDTMRDYATLALEQAKQLHYRKGQTLGLLHLANYHSFKGQKLQTFQMLQRADSILTVAPSIPEQVRLYRLQALFYAGLDMDKALALQFKAMALVDSAGITRMRTPTLIELAGMLNQVKDTAGASKYLKLCLDQAYREGDRATIGVAYGLLGGLNFEHNPTRGLEFLQLAEQNLTAAGNHRELATLLLNIGTVHAMNADYPKAQSYFERGLRAHPPAGTRSNLYFNLGMLHGLLGDSTLEMNYYDSARIAAMGANDKRSEIHILTGMADLSIRLKNHEDAVEHLTRCLALKDTLTRETVRDKLALQEAIFDQNTQKREIQFLKQEAQAQSYQIWIYVLLALFTGTSLAFGLSLHQRRKEHRFMIQAQQQLAALTSRTEQQVERIDKQVPEAQSMQTIPVALGSKLLIKKLEQVAYFQADASLVFAIDQSDQRYVVDQTLTELEQKLPETFLRIHRGHIVNKALIRSIKRLESNRFQFTMNTEKETVLNSGRAHRDRIREALDI